MAIIFADRCLYLLTMLIRYDTHIDSWNVPYALPHSSLLKTSILRLRDAVAKPSLAYHGGFLFAKAFLTFPW